MPPFLDDVPRAVIQGGGADYGRGRERGVHDGIVFLEVVVRHICAGRTRTGPFTILVRILNRVRWVGGIVGEPNPTKNWSAYVSLREIYGFPVVWSYFLPLNFDLIE